MINIEKILARHNDDDTKTEKKHTSYLYLLDYINANASINTISIESNIRLEYPGDFYGLLNYHNINKKLWYVTMLLNGLNSSNEYDGLDHTIRMLDETDPTVRYIIEKMKKIV